MSSTARRCLVALCHNSPVVYAKTARSLMELGWGNRVETAKATHGFEVIDLAWFTTFPRVDALRDSAMNLAQVEGYTHVLFLDADMVWPTDVLTAMLAHHDKGIVGGLYVLRHAPHAPVGFAGSFRDPGSAVDQFYHVDLVPGSTALIPCDVVGMGCTLIPVSVLEAIGPRPWFEYRNDDDGWPRVTEDVPFCLKAKQAGYALWIDPAVRCGHVSDDLKDVRHHWRYQQAQQNTIDRLPFTMIVAEEPLPEEAA